MATYYINPSTGNDSNTSVQAQDSATPWRTVKATISKLTSGDTVHLAAGQYRENAVTSTKTNITWICDGAVQWMGTRAQPGGGWGWVNHSGDAYKIIGFVATYSFTPISIVEEDFNHWRPYLCDDASTNNPSLCYMEKPMRATGLLFSDVADRIPHCIRHEGTMYYDTGTDTLYYHSWQSEDPATLTIGIGAVNDGAWTLGSGNIMNPVGTAGYLMCMWCLRNAPTTGNLNEGGSLVLSSGGTGYLIRQAGFLQTRSVTHATNTTVATVQDCWVDQNTQRGEVIEVPVATLTRVGSTATVTLDPADDDGGMVTGNYKYIFGADQTEYNGKKLITVISNTEFTFQVEGTPDSPATGTILTTNEFSLGLASGPSPSPNSISSTSAGSGSVYDNIKVTRGFNSITNGAVGVTWKNIVAWCHPNHNITGSVAATFSNCFVTASQDGLFTASANSAPGIVVNNCIIEEKVNISNVATILSLDENIIGYVDIKGATPTITSDHNMILGMDESSGNDSPGVSGTIYTHTGTEYTTVGASSGVCTINGLECNSVRLPSDSWHDGSLFLGKRDTRLFSTLEEMIPSPGSILVGRRIGTWNRFRAPQLARQWPTRGYPSADRPLAGW